MGLNMNTYLKPLLALLLTTTAVSCVKTPELEEDETPSTIMEVQDSLSSAWGDADPLTMKPNDFLLQQTFRKIETGEDRMLLQEGITISKKEERTNDWLYTYLYQTETLTSDGNTQQSTREDHRTVTKAEPAMEVFQRGQKLKGEISPMADDLHMSLGFERLIGLAYACQLTSEQQKICTETLGYDSCEVKCFNLKSLEETRPAPDLIKAQPNCGGLPNCTMKVKTISFDWAAYYKKGEGTEKQKVNYSISMSPNLPFFSRVTDYCYRALAQAGTQKALVTVCTKLKNYQTSGN